MPQNSGLFPGRVRNFKIELENRNGFASLIRRLNNFDIDLALGKHKRTRSLKQNSYYWSVVIAELAEVAGTLPEEMHDALRFHFLADHTQEPLVTARSTTSLTTVEFSDYIDNVRQFAAEFYEKVIEDPISWENRLRLSGQFK